MNDGKDVPRSSYSIEEILAEEAIKKEKAEGAARQEKAENCPGSNDGVSPLTADDIVSSARHALNMESSDLFGKQPKKKAKKHRFFGRRKEQDDFIPEDDVYYGLQLKPLEEYRRDYEETLRLDPDTLRKAEAIARQRRELLLSRENGESKPEVRQEPESAEEASAAPAQKSVPEKKARSENSFAEKPVSAERTAGKASAAPAQISVPEEKAGSENSLAEKPVAAESPEEPVSPAAKTPQTVPKADEARQKSLNTFLRRAGLNEEDVFEEGAEAPPSPQEPEAPAASPTVSQLIFKPVSQPVPEPIPQPVPAPVPQPIPGPVPQPVPQPIPGPVPQPVPQPIPETGIPAVAPEITILEEPEPTVSGKEPAEVSKENFSAPEKAEKAAPEEPVPVKEPLPAPAAGNETPAPPPETEPPARPVPRYRASSAPLHVITLNCMNDALALEASGYQLPPVHAPEPLPFAPVPSAPKGETEPQEPSEPEGTPPQTSDEAEETPKETPSETDDFPSETGEKNISNLPESRQQAKTGRKHFRLFGTDEDVSVTDKEPENTEDELDDFDKPEDAPSVRSDLAAQVRRLALRLAVTGICTAVLVLFSVIWESSAALPAALHTAPQAFPVVEFIFLAAAAAFCWPTLLSGLQGLFTLQANSDSAVSLAVLSCAVQNIVFLFIGIPSGCCLYAPLAALALFLNTVGKFSMSRRILRNFRFLTSSEQKYAVQTFSDYNTALQLAKGLEIGEPRIIYQTKAGFLNHFLRHSYSDSDPSEHVSQLLAPIGFLVSLALCIASSVLTGNAENALTAFTAAACVCVPFANLLSVNLPLAHLNSVASRCGGMAVGWDAVKRFGDTNAVLLDAQDLFPGGTVVLTGIQTFAGQRIDDAILEATALTKTVGGPLCDLFSQIVKSRGNILPHVERPNYEDGLGVTGTVNDRMILVGTAALLRAHGVDAPSRDYEEKYLRAGKVPLYLSSGGILMAMFLVCYRTDRSRAVELRRMEYAGISMLVRTRDPNITPDLIASCFGLSRHFIRILPDNLGDVYDFLRTHPPENASAVIVTKGRFPTMMRILTACMRQRGNIAIGVALQTAGVVLGLALAAFFILCGGLAQLSVTALLLFETFWTAAVIFIPRIRRP